MPTEIRAFIRSLGIDAYVVGGAVRDELLGIPHDDEDFLVPGVDHGGLRRLLEPHGRIEDMEVHGQLVGVRLHPRDRALRALVPAGIELTPPRTEQSTGPGHRDFEIVADASVSIAEDMGRRDFTINAMARNLATGELVDPFGGRADLAARRLRVIRDTSFREDPLRVLRGLRLVSQLGFELDPATTEQMRRDVDGLRHVSAERIGGGLDAGLGELSKLLLGREPGRALRLARDVGALQLVLPELGPCIGYQLAGERQPVPLDEHLFAVVEKAGAVGARLEIRLAALLHDVGKPTADARGADHAEEGAELTRRALGRLRYPRALNRRVTAIVSAHAFRTDHVWDGIATRRFLARHGLPLVRDLLVLKRADLAAKHVTVAEREGLAALEAAVERERASPHRVTDLAIDGGDLIRLGLAEGPLIGDLLRRLLDAVVDDPIMNDRSTLLELARRLAA